LLKELTSWVDHYAETFEIYLISMKKPNLYIVGHPRTGTSSLHDYLNQHPDIFMTPIKEPNYFAKDFQAESDRIHQKALYFPFRTEKRYLKCYKNT